MLCNNLARLPKKTGGDRTIAIATTIYRLMMALDHDRILAYGQSHAYYRDSAGKGQSALHSAEDRAFDAELATLSGHTTHQVLWDIDNLFDSIDIPTLIRLARHCHFPLWELSFTLLVHQAPRRLISRDAVGTPIVGLGRSILAGCNMIGTAFKMIAIFQSFRCNLSQNRCAKCLENDWNMGLGHSNHIPIIPIILVEILRNDFDSWCSTNHCKFVSPYTIDIHYGWCIHI